ncbi:RDD family protein [Alginatibacterium sediminis]|uniref:RDD family protein n=1 Tax=Alginatibacterium sediminis TaxID=2164068 RepID=A0A420ED74_9ALTE|nr:RDD family protein [Alginatibacterium sediminis]RKF18657.1 RDD family protein [Alginatibacterium sediminis]
MSQTKNEQKLPSSGFFRRLGAWIYDAFMAIAIAMVVIMLSLGIVAGGQASGLLVLDEGVQHSQYLVQQWWFQVLIWGSITCFYAVFWSRAGQTIGMRAWRLRVQRPDGSNISFTQALIRVFTAAFGLGNLMVLVTKNNTAFQDLWAKTEMVVLPKVAK